MKAAGVGVCLIVVAIIALMTLMFATPFISLSQEHETDGKWRAEAVKHGCGDFRVDDSLTGKTYFHWRAP